MSDNYSSSNCYNSKIGASVEIAFYITKMVVILPLSIIVLYLGNQRWRRRQQRSFATMSHSDIFTYHLTATELIFALGTTFLICGQYINHSVVITIGIYAIDIAYPGEMLFNTVTCVERYLAVVHPITYLGLRKSGGVRNICIGCVWLLCLVWLGVEILHYPDVPYIEYVCVVGVSLVTVSFCSLSVLCVLIRPGPGEMGGDRQRVNQSKQKAFHTITAIMVVLLVSFLGILVTVVLDTSDLLNNIDKCLILLSGIWFNLPISLVLPLLFLHRAGKLSFCVFSNK